MKIFTCPTCNGPLYFDNLTCACGTSVSFDPEAEAFEQLDVPCANREQIDCNWHAEAGPGTYCRACAMTEIVPDSLVTTNIPLWADTEAAKRWVLDNLGRWHWFRPEDPGTRPMFHMLGEYGENPAPMGHAQGVVTISVAEADPVIRTKRRQALGEPYRTMIGHMRHEIAHMLWWRLSLRDDFLDAFREMFGDERADYGQALQRHYQNGPPADWPQRYLSSYASAHPHEDWAETTAHLLHLTDITDSFVAAGFSSPNLPGGSWDPYAETDSERLIYIGASIAVGTNHLNRSMGLADLYPFLLAESTHRKLAFVHRWLRRGAQGL